MHRQRALPSCGFSALTLLAIVISSPAAAQPAPEAAQPAPEATQPAPEAEIAKVVTTYVNAFNAKDVDKLASHWTAEGTYQDLATGESVKGRDDMVAQFRKTFSDPNGAPKLAIITESIEMVSSRVGIERGRAVVTHADESVTESTYEVVYVKEGDKWLIDRVTEDTTEVSRQERLAELEWMIGDWVDAGEGFTIELSCNWTANKTYISRKYKVTSEDGVTSSGLQIIGWDAKSRKIRSWLFDSEGGLAQGTWSSRDGRWVVQTVATLPDGETGSFTAIFTPTDDGNYRWQKINRVLDGKILPNIPEIIVQRKQ